jgi:hypothetical protein
MGNTVAVSKCADDVVRAGKERAMLAPERERDDGLLSPVDAARELGVPPATVRRWIEQGWLTAERAGQDPVINRRVLGNCLDTLMYDPRASTDLEREQMHVCLTQRAA